MDTVLMGDPLGPSIGGPALPQGGDMHGGLRSVRWLRRLMDRTPLGDSRRSLSRQRGMTRRGKRGDRIGGCGVITVVTAVHGALLRKKGNEAVGLLRNKPGAVRSSREQPRSTAAEATGLHGSDLVYCRQCATWVAVSATRELSTHPTSRGVVTYFRCSSGHVDFKRTSTAPPRSRRAKPQT